MLALPALLIPGTPADAGSDPATDEAAFVAMINQLRSSRGLQTLRIDTELTTEARRWTSQMAASDQLAHAPDLSHGISADWEVLGENVGVHGVADLAALFQAFTMSPSHLDNLVDPRFDSIGVGVVHEADGTIWTTHRFMSVRQPAVATPKPTLGHTVAPVEPALAPIPELPLTPPTSLPPPPATTTTTTLPPATTTLPPTTTTTLPPTTAKPTTTARPTTTTLPTTASKPTTSAIPVTTQQPTTTTTAPKPTTGEAEPTKAAKATTSKAQAMADFTASAIGGSSPASGPEQQPPTADGRSNPVTSTAPLVPEEPLLSSGDAPMRTPEPTSDTSPVKAFNPAPLPPPTTVQPPGAAEPLAIDRPMPPAPFADWPTPTITARLLTFEIVITVEPSPIIPFAPNPAQPVLTPLLPTPSVGPLVRPTPQRTPVDQQLVAAILGDVDEAGL
ncbi:MAG: hypothetical protein GY939_12190 [Actinomycetia bacterium]|nr:hypothetical protein [Actinomycetes bacterium]